MKRVTMAMLVDYNPIIPDRLWVGGLVHPGDAKQLQRMGITVVVSLQTDRDLKNNRISPEKLAKALAGANIDLRRAPIEEFDASDLEQQLPKCVAELEAALEPAWAKAYLHCTAGVIRSATVAAAYIIKNYSRTAEEAWEWLIEKRDCRPELNVLRNYELRMTYDE